MTRRRYKPRSRTGPLLGALLVTLLVGGGLWAFASGLLHVEIGSGKSEPVQHGASQSQAVPPHEDETQPPQTDDEPTQPTPAEGPDAATPQKPSESVPTLDNVKAKRVELEALAMKAWKTYGEVLSESENAERRRAGEHAVRQADKALGCLQGCEDALRGGNAFKASTYWGAMEEREQSARSYLKEVR